MKAMLLSTRLVTRPKYHEYIIMIGPIIYLYVPQQFPIEYHRLRMLSITYVLSTISTFS